MKTLLAAKVGTARIFSDEEGQMNRSLRDIGGNIPRAGQSTPVADWRCGDRPDFSRAAAPEEGNRLYAAFKTALAADGAPVPSGRFGSDMAIAPVDDGPVTIWMNGRDAQKIQRHHGTMGRGRRARFSKIQPRFGMTAQISKSSTTDSS